MKNTQIKVEMRTKSRSLRFKEAVLASFWEPAPSLRARFSEFSVADWKRALYWLDVSGLALYLFDRLTAFELLDCLPSSILWKLRKNLADNRERTDSLFAEAVAVSHLLKQQNIRFAILKGVTLPSKSVPDSSLRCQADLDILVREPDALHAQDCLRALGYELNVVSGATWEFKAGAAGLSTIKDIYSVRPGRSLEMHVLQTSSQDCAPSPDPSPDLLDKAHLRIIQGVALPVLSPADLFVQQAVHLFKHMCGEYTRAAWVLEFWRHVSARRNDMEFWREVECAAAREPNAYIAIGASLLLTSLVFGPCAPDQLARWSLDRLSPAVCLWIQMYGRQILLADSPRSKLYLLLLRELRPDSAVGRSARLRLIFPIHMPPSVTRGEANERLSSRLLRYGAQARFALIRLRFHAAEGFRLAFESIRWQRRLAEVTQ
jgi:hypothetical protein